MLTHQHPPLLPLLLLLHLLLVPPVADASVLRYADQSQPKTPIVLIPGDGGSQIQARLDGKPSVPHFWCSKRTADFYPIWLNLELLNAGTVDCLVDDFRLVFDPATNLTSNSPKVVTRVPGFGDTATVEYFDDSKISASAYFNDLAIKLVAYGYRRNVTLRGAPFDFRRGVHDNPQFQSDLKSLIEATTAANAGRPCLLVAHSYGNTVTLAMLQQQTPDWKRRHVRALLAVAAPLGGAVKALRLMSSGDSLDIPLERPLAMRPLQRSLTSTALLMPHPQFWPAGETLISRPGRNYSTAEYDQFFVDIGYQLGSRMRAAAVAGYRPDLPPGVEVHCVYGYGLKTPGRLIWRSNADWPDAQPDVDWDDGDGTVNSRSLAACADLWGGGAQAQPVFNFTIPGAEHLKILHRPEFLQYTLDLVHRLNAETAHPDAL
ncbi:hypothetical protein BOX15_Mlig030608g4 [Macrostomum lignano]|uniref:AB hydrolase-1 domain-containing protein n=3 Tax=Macrostomum lignano TaxID=282301 RepID=A0A1I8H6K4_9PLAT|nr:hypothetical protein BOX15_Mlig030608g4 [Macrostomum lignano]